MAKRNLQKYLERSGMLGKMSDAEVPMLEAIVSGVNIDRIAQTFLKAVTNQIAIRASNSSTVSKLMSNRSIIQNAASWGPGLVSSAPSKRSIHHELVDLNAMSRVRDRQRRIAQEEARRSSDNTDMFLDEHGNWRKYYSENDPRLPKNIGNVNSRDPSRDYAAVANMRMEKLLHGKSSASITDAFDPENSPLIQQEMRLKEFSDNLSNIAKARRHAAVKKRSEATTKAKYDEAEAQRAYDWEMMSDEQRERATLSEKFHGNQQMVDDVMDKRQKEKYLKGLPEFFKNSKMSTKSLKFMEGAFKTAKGLGLLRGIPMGGGPFGVVGAGMKMAHRVVGVAKDFAKRRNEADRYVVGIRNAQQFYGAPSGRYFHGALGSGMEAKNAIQKLGRFNVKMAGRGEEFLDYIATATADMDPVQRAMILDQLGIDEEMFATAMLASGKREFNKSRRNIAGRELSVMALNKMRSSESNVAKQILGMVGEKAFGPDSMASEMGKKLVPKRYTVPTQPAKDANSAAESAQRYSSGSLDGKTSSVENNNSATINIGNLNVNPEGAKNMFASLQKAAGTSNTVVVQVLDSMDSMIG